MAAKGKRLGGCSLPAKSDSLGGFGHSPLEQVVCLRGPGIGKGLKRVFRQEQERQTRPVLLPGCRRMGRPGPEAGPVGNASLPFRGLGREGFPLGAKLERAEFDFEAKTHLGNLQNAHLNWEQSADICRLSHVR